MYYLVWLIEKINQTDVELTLLVGIDGINYTRGFEKTSNPDSGLDFPFDM